jgi:hypothetical protein
MRQAPLIAFLGFVERSAQVQDGHQSLLKYNILGLKQHFFSLVYPFTLRAGGLAVAIYDPQLSDSFKLVWRTEFGAEVGTIDITFPDKAVKAEPETALTPETAPVLRKDGPLMICPPGGWAFAVLPTAGLNLTINAPGLYHIYLRADEGETRVGSFTFGLSRAEPLTEARIAAIRSDPSAIKAVRLDLHCNHCNDAIRPYAGLERSAKQEEEGWVWYEMLPDSFTCKCGKLNADLTIMRTNLHGLLGQRSTTSGELSFVPAYEREALYTMRTNFRALLEQGAREEVLQTFIEENLVLLHQFSPQEIWFKAPILTSFKTDFAILSHNAELLLIELEKPQTHLLKRDGGVHSELQHAFDQVRDWLHLADEHRQAFVSCIGAEPKEVGAVKGVIIAGRDVGYDPDHLRKLKGADFGRVKFMTYDDLSAAFDALLRALDNT